MVREVELKIIENNAVSGSLELSDFSDFSFTLTKGISDINSMNVRSGTYSLNFNIPATKANNVLLGFLDHINTKGKADILTRKDCVVFVDGLQVETGQIKVELSDSKGVYKGTFFGKNTDWLIALADINMNQLDWRDAVTTFDSATIGALLNSDVDSNDINYPYVDRNTGSAAVNLRPVIYAKAFLDAAFAKIGYTIDSDFFETADFKKLAIDFQANFEFDQDALEATELEQSVTGLNDALTPPNWAADTMVGNLGTPAAPNIRKFYRFPNLFDNQIKDNSGLWTQSSSEYTVQVTSLYQINLAFNYEFRGYQASATDWELYDQTLLGSPFNVRPPNFRWYVVDGNTSDTVIDGTILFQGEGQIQQELIFIEDEILLTQGQNVSIFLELIDDAFGMFPGSLLNAPSLDRWSVRIKNDSAVTFIRKGTISTGDDYALNTVIPTDVSCLDLISDFKTLFNLYFLADPFRMVIKIEPRDDFYLNLSEAEDWTKLMALDKGYSLNYATNYGKTLQFRYIEDDDDKYLEEWDVINARTYGKYDQILSDRFDKADSLIQTKVLSPVIQGVMTGNIVTSVIRNEYGDLSTFSGIQTKKYKFRLFNLIRQQQFDSAGNPRRTQSPLVVTCALSESFGNVTAPINLNFAGSDGLFANYYAKTISNLLEGGIVTAYFNISLARYQNLNLRRPIYLSAPEKIKGHYIVQKVNQFNVVNEKLTKVELLRLENYEPATVDTSQPGNITETIGGGQPPNIQPILIEETINGTNYLIDVYAEQGNTIVPVFKE